MNSLLGKVRIEIRIKANYDLTIIRSQIIQSDDYIGVNLQFLIIFFFSMIKI